MTDASDISPGADPATAALARKSAMAADMDARLAILEANIGMRGKPSLNVSQAYDPPALLAGGTSSTTVSVPGAKIGDYALAGLIPAAPANYQVTATVTAADTVTIGIVQHSSNVLYDHPAGTIHVRVYPA